MKPIFIIVVFSLLLSHQLQAQDYVITTKGDSLPCNIKRTFSGTRFRYQTDKMKDFKIIKTDEIKEFYCDKEGLTMRAVILEDEAEFKFLSLIDRGKIYLYEDLGNFNNSDFTPTKGGVNFNYTASLYVSKGPSDKIKLLRTNLVTDKSRDELKNRFAEMIKDNPSLYEKFKVNDRFGAPYLIKLIHFYNTGLLL